MIDEYWTWIFYGYHSDELKPQSRKPIVASCDGCCQYRVLRKDGYSDLCTSCARTGIKKPPLTEEHRHKLSVSLKNRKRGPRSDETKRKISEALLGKPLSDKQIAANTMRRGVTLSAACVAAMKRTHNEEKLPLPDGWEVDKDSKMVTNRACSAYLGCYIAERVLSNVFKNVQMMPIGHPGYDFICGNGYKIDVKSATFGTKYHRASFNIRKNVIADYFLCIAFDNRTDLNPLYMWLIPGDDINHLNATGVSISTIDKWNKYEIGVDKVVACCDTLRGD